MLDLAPVWAQAEARIRAEGRYPPSWFVLLTIAGLIAAVGIFTNSQILIVGAMVVGPEYAAIISVALGIDTADRRRVGVGTGALVFGFLIAIAVTLAFSLLVRAFGWQTEAFSLGVRPVSDLIDSPDAFSVVVATLAGIVGVVSLVEARTGALIGVFISVTTIPAAADIGVSTALGNWNEALGSLARVAVERCDPDRGGCDRARRATAHLAGARGTHSPDLDVVARHARAVGTRHPNSSTWPYGWTVSAPPGRPGTRRGDASSVALGRSARPASGGLHQGNSAGLRGIRAFRWPTRLQPE